MIWIHRKTAAPPVRNEWYYDAAIESWCFHAADAYLQVWRAPFREDQWHTFILHDPDFLNGTIYPAQLFPTREEAQAWCLTQLALLRSEHAALDVPIPA